jgi:hypothetical protein
MLLLVILVSISALICGNVLGKSKEIEEFLTWLQRNDVVSISLLKTINTRSNPLSSVLFLGN